MEKSKIPVAGREEVVLQVEIDLNDEMMDVVSLFKYLGSCFSENGGLQDDVVGEQVLKDEALRAMNLAVNQLSYNPNKHTSVSLETMFLDSDIAKHFTCGKDRSSYLSSFVLVPYFYDELTQSLSDVPFYTSERCIMVSNFPYLFSSDWPESFFVGFSDLLDYEMTNDKNV